ncbi:MAG: hypothetical protein WCF78_00515 [archaeon]
MLVYNYLIKYPFSSKAREYLKSKDIDLLSIDENLIKKATMFLINTINLPVQDREKQWKMYLSENDIKIADIFVTIYPISRLLLSIVDYNPLYQQFAVYYQKQFKYYLNNSKDDSELDELLADLSPEIKYNEQEHKYLINLIDYLKYELGDEYKLQYINLKAGIIYFEKEELINLLSVILKKRILSNINIEKKELPKTFKEYGQYIKEKIIKENTYNIKTISKVDYKEFPPCFMQMYNKIMSGEKLTHIENFSLAVFLSNIGYSYDEILSIYKHLPNFDEKIASYQIKALMEKKYSVPNCDTIKGNGLCVADCKVKHPFQLFNKIKKGEKENGKNK